MSENLFAFIALIAPAAFLATAIASWFQPGYKPKFMISLSMLSTVIGILISLICGISVYNFGLSETPLIGIADLGFSIRLDALSTLMISMIALLGFIIVKFSANYLDGDQRQGAFIGRLAATIASVQFLVLAGNLALLFVAWMLTSISLHRLLVFYHERPVARIAAKKKFIIARLGDAALLIAGAALYNAFGTGNLEVIFNAISSGLTPTETSLSIEIAALFLVLAAVLKSAQFPTHGWLIEVMETPTPVSALLHAGLLNAGPFLIVRMSIVMDASTAAPIILMTIGGLTALFGSVVYLTQTSVKTALAFSSIAHMGFSLMMCGLGVYAAAMLHMVAHSFYKAHSFLSSGSIIDVVRGSKIVKENTVVTPMKIVLGTAMALVVFAGFTLLWGIEIQKDWSLMLIGSIIVMGLAKIFVAALSYKANPMLMVNAIALALAVSASFFVLESSMHHVLQNQLPLAINPGLGKLIVAIPLLLLFGAVVFIQMIAPNLEHNPKYMALAIHLRNGLYANAYFDRLVGALNIYSAESKQVIEQPETPTVHIKSHSMAGL
jgi:NAD(P)H-quinone oxidoreductase subunit 5